LNFKNTFLNKKQQCKVFWKNQRQVFIVVLKKIKQF
jgi:hypothetical protein